MYYNALYSNFHRPRKAPQANIKSRTFEAFLHVPASYVVACAVMLHVLDRLLFVTMTENSYIVLGLRPVAV